MWEFLQSNPSVITSLVTILLGTGAIGLIWKMFNQSKENLKTGYEAKLNACDTEIRALKGRIDDLQSKHNAELATRQVEIERLNTEKELTSVTRAAEIIKAHQEYTGSIENLLKQSQTGTEMHGTAPRQIILPDNIVKEDSYASLTHSGSEEVIRALSQATASPIVALDLKTGRAWWATRLFALAAGAVHLGSPKVIVFLATKENINQIFIGWAEPTAILDALLQFKPEYKINYLSAKAIYNELSLFSDPQFLFNIRPEFSNNLDVGVVSDELCREFSQISANAKVIIEKPGSRWVISDSGQKYSVRKERDKLTIYYHSLPDFQLSTDALNYQYTYEQDKKHAFTQILMDKLGRLEYQPDWVTITLLSEMLTPYLYMQSIDLNLPNKAQIQSLFEVQAPFMPITRRNEFVGIIPTVQVLKAVMEDVIQQWSSETG